MLARTLRHTLALLALTVAAAHANESVVAIRPGDGGVGEDPLPGPDLVARYLGARPLVLAHGEAAVLPVRVSNVGQSAADASCLVGTSGDVRDVLYTPPLGPGESDTRDVVLAGLAPGAHTVRLCADGTSAVAERPRTAEGNNCVTAIVEVQPPPLHVEWLDLRVSPATGSPGRAVTVYARTRNAGSASRSYPVRFTLDGQVVGDRFCPAVLGDAPCEMQLQISAPLTEGTHRLWGHADGRSMTADLRVDGPRPNLMMRPDDLQRDIGLPRAGQTFRFSFAARNAGAIGTDRTFSVDVYLGATRIATTRCYGLAVGDRCAGSTVLELPAGQHELRVVADPDGVVDETREDDNTRFMTFEVGPGGVTCAGDWTLVGDDGWQASSYGYVIDGCQIYWASNSPFPGACMQTVGDQGMVASWYAHPVTGCPVAVDVTGQDEDGEPVYHHFQVRTR